MSKTNDTKKMRELTEAELVWVSGGVRKGGAIIVFDYEGSALRVGTSAQHPAKVTVPDLKLS